MIDIHSLPKVLADLLAAQSKFDSDDFVKNFTGDAVVHDEGGVYRGQKEIKQWNEATNRKYQTRMEPIAFEDNKDESTLTIRMSGTFPGSPVSARFHFVIKDNKITSLRID